MIGEATSPNRGPGFRSVRGYSPSSGLAPGGAPRRGFHSLRHCNRNRPFDDHRARLTAWYEQFVQRSQPFIGWQPLTKAEMEADDNQSSFGSTRAEEPISRSESPMISKELPPFTRPVSVAQDQPSATHLERFSGRTAKATGIRRYCVDLSPGRFIRPQSHCLQVSSRAE